MSLLIVTAVTMNWIFFWSVEWEIAQVTYDPSTA